MLKSSDRRDNMKIFSLSGSIIRRFYLADNFSRHRIYILALISNFDWHYILTDIKNLFNVFLFKKNYFSKSILTKNNKFCNQKFFQCQLSIIFNQKLIAQSIIPLSKRQTETPLIDSRLAKTTLK